MSLAVTAVYTQWHWPVDVRLVNWCIGNKRTWKYPALGHGITNLSFPAHTRPTCTNIQEAQLLSNMERIHCQVLWHYIHCTSLWENCGIQPNLSLPYKHTPFNNFLVSSKTNKWPWEVKLISYSPPQIAGAVCHFNFFFYSTLYLPSAMDKRHICVSVKQYKREQFL